MTNRLGMLLAGAAVATMAVPAQARDRHADTHHHERHHRDGDSGLAFGALLVAGLVAAVAGAARQPVPATVAETSLPDDAEAAPPSFFYQGDWDEDPDKVAAIRACTASIEWRARQQSPFAQVTSVTTVVSLLDRYTVHGRVVLRDQPQAAGEKHVFRCRVVPGQVERASIDERA